MHFFFVINLKKYLLLRRERELRNNKNLFIIRQETRVCLIKKLGQILFCFCPQNNKCKKHIFSDLYSGLNILI